MGSRFIERGSFHTKRRNPVRTTAVNKPARSKTRDLSSRKSNPAHVRSAGATTRAPPASPSHQVNQTAPRFAGTARPARRSDIVPIVALTTVLRSVARNANLKTSCGRSKARDPFANAFTRCAPMIASSELPTAMPNDEGTSAVVVTFTRKAPIAIPGQTRRPIRSSAASAMPVGGHTAVVLVLTSARLSPNLPATKYAAARPRIDRARGKSPRDGIGRRPIARRAYG